MAKIRGVVVEGDREHGYKRVQVLFGTNYPSLTVNCRSILARFRSGIRKAVLNRTKQRDRV
jgi:hypothetical protein